MGTGPALVMAAYIQKTTLLSRDSRQPWQRPIPEAPLHHLTAERSCGPHLSTCGHAMHATCYQKFFDSLVQKERHNAINLMGKILNFDVSIGEFTCPICERLSNSVLPLIPSITALRAKQSSAPIPEIGLNAFVTGLASTVESWFLKEDKDEGPSLPRIDVRTTMEEQVRHRPRIRFQLKNPAFFQASIHGREFAQCFQTTQESDCFPLEEVILPLKLFLPFDSQFHLQYPLQGLTSMMNAFSLAAFTTSLELNPFDEDYKVIKTFADRFLADFHPVSRFFLVT